MLSDPETRPLLLKSIIGEARPAGANDPPAEDISAGTFGGTGGGNYSFPAALSINGNLGIGTPSGGVKLAVFGTVPGDVSYWILSKSGAVNDAQNIVFLMPNTAGTVGSTAALRAVIEAVDASKARTGLGFITGQHDYTAERMRIAGDGKVGIGTLSPGEKLEVKGFGKFSDPGSDAGIKFEAGSIIRNAATGNIDITPQSGYASVFTAGNVGIGTPTPGARLDVNGEVSAPVIKETATEYSGNFDITDHSPRKVFFNVPGSDNNVLTYYKIARVKILGTYSNVHFYGWLDTGGSHVGWERRMEVEVRVFTMAVATDSTLVYSKRGQNTEYFCAYKIEDGDGSGHDYYDLYVKQRWWDGTTGEIDIRVGCGTAAVTVWQTGSNCGTGTPGGTLQSPNADYTVDKLNKIIFLRPLGPSSYDSAQINNEIAGLAATHGGIIMLEPGEYRINATINLNVNGVKLRGYGGGWVNYPYEGGQATKLVWYGPSGSAVADPNKDPHLAIVECRWADPDTALQDLAISDLSILGNGRTNVTGLLLDHVSGSIFRNVEINDVTEGIWLTSKATAADVDTDFNLFENCAVLNAQRGVVFTQNSQAAVNACHNTFIGLSLEFLGQEPPTPPPPDVDLWALAAGIHLVDCDNNSFYRTWVYRQGGSAGHWVRIESPINARANYFYHLQGEIFVKNANPQQPPDNLTTVFGYDRENAQNPPRAKTSTGATVDVWDYVFWVDSHGSINNDDAQDPRGSVIARGCGRFASMKIGATEVISGARLLHNVTADAAILPLATETTRGAVTMSTETSSVACADDDSRLFDARTPTAHAGSHGEAGGDAITVEESQVTGLVTDLAAKVAGASGVASLRGGKATLSSGYVWVLTGLSSLTSVVVSLVVNGACPAEAVCAYWTTGGNFVINSSDSSSTSEVAWLAVGT